MAINHTIKTEKGELKNVTLTPLRAIRALCMECCAWAPKEVKLCPNKHCPAYPYRLGHNPQRQGVGGG